MVVKKFLLKILLQIFAYLITKVSCAIYHSYVMKRRFCKHHNSAFCTKNEELCFWLKCRGDSLKGLKTKAALVKR